MDKLLVPTHTRVKTLQWCLHLSIIPAVAYGTWYYWSIALIVFWFMHGFGSGIGAHRYYTHHTFEANKFWQVFMNFCFTVSCTGSTIGYTLMHLKHHAHTDREDDPHSPANGFWRTWWGLYDESKLKFGHKTYIRLMNDPIMRFFHRYYFGIIAAYAAVLALINPLLVVFAFAIPAVMQFQTNAVLIVLAHSHRARLVGGYRNVETRDNSYNIWWLKPLLLGEELHNNHHSKPASVTMNLGNGWRDFDPLYYLIKYVMRGKIQGEQSTA